MRCEIDKRLLLGSVNGKKYEANCFVICDRSLFLYFNTFFVNIVGVPLENYRVYTVYNQETSHRGTGRDDRRWVRRGDDGIAE